MPNSIFIKSSSDLTEEEKIIYDWQYRLDEGFSRALMGAVSKADGGNLDRLSKGFPVHVKAYERFAYEAGWWEGIQKRMGV